MTNKVKETAEVLSQGLPRRIIRMNVLDEQFEYFTKRGIFYLDSEIEEGIPSVLSMALLRRNNELDKAKPLWVILNSPGGRVDQGFAIYDVLRMVAIGGRTINILCMGTVASMATFVLQAGTRRLSLPHTQFLIHEVSQFTSGDEKVSEGEERVAENRRLNTVVMAGIAKRIGMDPDKLIKLSKKKDCWLNTEDARKLGTEGLIDEVVESIPFDM